uniref:Uncharacterized protein n=1 Tax=Rhizophora mucronata TaxID=61149 RepID=A0A2P2NMF8_RHIMU
MASMSCVSLVNIFSDHVIWFVLAVSKNLEFGSIHSVGVGFIYYCFDRTFSKFIDCRIHPE